MINYERLGAHLQQARERAGMTQADVAAVLGLTSAALSLYEKGRRRVDALTLEQLSRLYAVPIGDFFADESAIADWVRSLQSRVEHLSVDAKRGIAHVIEKVRNLELLYRETESLLPGLPHPPFAPLPERHFADEEVAEMAEGARRYYDVGIAPLPDLRRFLETIGYQVFVVPLGIGDDALSGLFFRHHALGPIVVLNEDESYTRFPFTLAHELAHGLFHYDREVILCRSHDQRLIEDFADRFASYFLVPPEALHEVLRRMGITTIEQPEVVVHLARYFGISYRAMFNRLRFERRIAAPWDAFQIAPVVMARALGYTPSEYEFGRRPLPPEVRLPRLYIQLGYQAARSGQLSLRRVAEIMGISDIELEERLEIFDDIENEAEDISLESTEKRKWAAA